MKYFSGTILGVMGFSLTVFILTTIVEVLISILAPVVSSILLEVVVK